MGRSGAPVSQDRVVPREPEHWTVTTYDGAFCGTVNRTPDVQGGEYIADSLVSGGSMPSFDNLRDAAKWLAARWAHYKETEARGVRCCW